MPVRNTTGNSSPLAEWRVMSVTPRVPSGSSSTSLTRATPSVARARVAEAPERRAADAAPGRLNGAAEGDVVRGVHDEAQVRERVLDLLALVDPHRPDDDVRDAAAPQRVLEHAGLRVRA